MQAPDRQATTILVAYGLAVTAWLMGGPADMTSFAFVVLLPTLAGYEACRQCADEAPGGRE
ncbi:MAG: hypothetical protein OXE53_06280 [Deltaproteobacteria bacterium]|nr:hypothetical protein [Deltaproteobacteria bacterium]